KHKHNQWSLQKAIADAFDEFLGKSHSESKWRQSLTSSNQTTQGICHELIRYAASDCLAITKLQLLVICNWKYEQLDRHKRNK
ncbi:unnamed protein product, partial [Adineta ricciae]